MLGPFAVVTPFLLTFTIPIAAAAAVVSGVATAIALLNARRELPYPARSPTGSGASDLVPGDDRTAIKTELLVKKEAEELLRLHDELLAVVQRNRRVLVEMGAAENDGITEG